MKNSTVKETSISTFEKVSRSLVAQWKALNNVKTSTSDKGFDTRLGRQLQICRANSSSDKQNIEFINCNSLSNISVS